VDDRSKPRIAVVGAGFGGIAAAIALRRAGFRDLVVLEKGDRIGGVWQVRDPALRAKVTPQEPMGCKRVLFTSSWLPALARPDVDLITEKIQELTPAGVRTADGVEHPCDLVVYGTGFAATEFLVPIRVTGRAGRPLDEVWRDGAHAHLGLTVPGFPNLFLVYGPNTNTGNTSVVYFHEAQARYIVQAVRRIAAGAGPLEVRPEVAAAYDSELQQRLAGSVWTACQSWYRTPAGRIVTNWPGPAGEYARRTAHLDPADFHPAGSPPADVRPAGFRPAGD
jgi:cation diffusion facilitator CzcD-associated flavoprotein CzcO